MNTKNSTVIGLVLLAFVLLFLWGYTGRTGTAASVQNAGQTLAGGVLTAAGTFHDFGTISMKDGNVTKEFTITNQSASPVKVSTVVTSCMCTSAFLVNARGSVKGPFGMPGMGYVPPADEVIEAGGSRTLRVVYNPNAHGPAGVGAIDRFITVTDSTGAALQFEIKANVTP